MARTELSALARFLASSTCRGAKDDAETRPALCVAEGGWRSAVRQWSLKLFKNCVERLFCRACLVMTAVALAACTSSDPVQQQSRTVASAAQTAALVTDAWMAGAAPARYTAATLQSLAETVTEADRQLRSDASPEPGRRSEVSAAMTRLSTAMKDAEAAVKTGSRPQADKARQDLNGAMADLTVAAARYDQPKS
ncbi:hypothetical protein FJ934_02910 [Mesorhizobium sp. B2-4-12]|uniref:hypothetical protein n=1 Tax=Mesorhizobium sp. B2-4-12 TaxID=2589937 RepID=UPI001126D113|nr:hypothetical protein [Mesorhizobium sp. B2-4-12]TPK98736.1 hypothetical protein FJ934_02910 [Mesorhizobium sp. B2-4-12]TPL12400.1 hypothetical protein FJ938_00565 [Mesorhizobium sp. B2-4-14]